MTLLTNPKMAPELVRRIEASVSGGGKASPAAAARATAIIRLLVVAAVIVVAAGLVFGRRQEKEQVERDRSALLETLRAQRASLSNDDQQTLPRAESLLLRASGPYEGDATDLASQAALDAVLASPSIYVHGPIDGFERASRIPGAASSSIKDTFLLCLADPPASREESPILSKVRAAYAGLGIEKHTPEIHRLHDAEAGARLLSAAFEERIKLAQSGRDLAALRAELDPDVLERAKATMKAKTLIAVMDEPGPSSAPAELDGERAHHVRVMILELASGKVLLRRRAHVDPGAWSSKPRSELAAGLDQCGLAYDLREGLKR